MSLAQYAHCGDGLDPNTVLVSVRQMRALHGIHTYFNSDNEAGISDCLRFPNGVYVPFTSDRFELTGTGVIQVEKCDNESLKGTLQ